MGEKFKCKVHAYNPKRQIFSHSGAHINKLTSTKSSSFNFIEKQKIAFSSDDIKIAKKHEQWNCIFRRNLIQKDIID